MLTIVPLLVGTWSMAIGSALIGVGVGNDLLLAGFGLVMFGAFIPMASICLFGWPQRLIPPPYRDGAGVLRRNEAARSTARAEDS